MKTKNIFLLSLPFLIGTFLFFTIPSCKKEKDSSATSTTSSTSSSKNSNALLGGDEDEITEDDIITFIDNIKDQIETPSEEMVDLEPTLLLMQKTVNYCFSDIDSPFVEDLDPIVIPLTFTISGGRIAMNQASDIMVDIKDQINNTIASYAPTYQVRLLSSSIENASGGGYEIQLYFGKTGTTITTPSPLTSGASWNRISNTSCTILGPNIIEAKGREWLLYSRNSIDPAATFGYENYFEGTVDLPLSGSYHPGATYNISTINLPSPNSIGGYTPYSSPIFAINRLAANLIGSNYELCIPAVQLNFYSENVPTAFDYVRPNGYVYPLANEFKIPQTEDAFILSSAFHLIHRYAFKGTTLKTRLQAHPNY